MIKLKPCPFCGGKARWRYRKPIGWVMCKKCGASSATLSDNYEEADCQQEAIAAWNRRSDAVPVVLPCKIGEKVYRYCNDAINEGTIINILLNVKTGEIGLEYEMPTCYTCSRSGTLGKNLFLTREAVEKALMDIAKEESK